MWWHVVALRACGIACERDCRLRSWVSGNEGDLGIPLRDFVDGGVVAVALPGFGAERPDGFSATKDACAEWLGEANIFHPRVRVAAASSGVADIRDRRGDAQGCPRGRRRSAEHGFAPDRSGRPARPGKGYRGGSRRGHEPKHARLLPLSSSQRRRRLVEREYRPDAVARTRPAPARPSRGGATPDARATSSILSEGSAQRPSYGGADPL
jgi:hypothetical protein